jgi:phage tail-like protein
MGMGRLASPDAIFKRKFRWMFYIETPGASDWIGDERQGISALPPLKGARPSVEFKDIEVQHVIEDIYLPGKPSWKPINLVLYDICPPSSKHPIWKWILQCYNPEQGRFFAILDNGFKKKCTLELYTGCGTIMETWTFENAWPSQVNFGDLDMSSSEVVTCDITLKYDRAYLVDPNF